MLYACGGAAEMDCDVSNPFLMMRFMAALEKGVHTEFLASLSEKDRKVIARAWVCWLRTESYLSVLWPQTVQDMMTETAMEDAQWAEKGSMIKMELVGCEPRLRLVHLWIMIWLCITAEIRKWYSSERNVARLGFFPAVSCLLGKQSSNSAQERRVCPLCVL